MMTSQNMLLTSRDMAMTSQGASLLVCSPEPEDFLNHEDFSFRCPSLPSFNESFQVYRKYIFVGSGCGAVGRVVACDARDLRFKSSHRQYYLLSTVLKNCTLKIYGKKGPGMAHSFFST